MAEMVPVYVGITGKRGFASDPQQNAVIEEEMRDRLRVLLDHLDARFPGTPKVLLTSLAMGADRIGAAEVLRRDESGRKLRPTWLVLAVLPFGEALYRQDFDSDQWSVYEELVRDPRTRVRTLPPLRTEDGEPAAPADLARSANATDLQRNTRRRHYEQAGMWIAETANVLIAVVSADETPDKIGGTARVVAFRRGARPDRTAESVLSGSIVLAPRPALERVPASVVWLVDPADERPHADLPMLALPPYESESERMRAYSLPVGFMPDAAARSPHPVARAAAPPAFASRTVSEIVRRLAVRGEAGDGGAADAAWPAASSAGEYLMSLREQLRATGDAAAHASRDTFYELVGLFLVAILVLEIFIKYLHHWSVLAVYVALVFRIMRVFFRATTSRVQPFAEDLRAIREALRIQKAWWDVGLRDRVDHIHLRDADADLRGVVEAARNVIVFADFGGPEPRGNPNWAAVVDPDNRPLCGEATSAASYPTDWVGQQLYYFRRRKDQRESRGQLAESLSWVLFATSLALAGLVALWKCLAAIAIALTGASPGVLSSLLATGRPWMWPVTACLGLVGAGAAWAWRGHRRRERRSHRRVWLSLGLGAVAAAFIFLTCRVVALSVVSDMAATATLCAVLALMVAITAVHWSRNMRPDVNATRLGGTVVALVAACGIAFLAQIVAHILEHAPSAGHLSGRATEAAILAEKMMIVFVVLLPAAAGVLRFLSERFAIEAEALSYRDAHGWFEHADRLLAELRPGTGDAAADAAARATVHRLGVLALQESGAWLKARRERPLTPFM